MSQRERSAFILDTLTREGHVDVDALGAELGVSTATIRRDLDALAQKQMLIRTRGGAVTNSSTYDLPLQYNALRNAEEKRRIAQAACDLVKPGMVIGLNAGTTTTELARAIALRPDLDGASPTLTIVTNAVNIAHELTVRSQFQVVVVGGTVRPASYELVGPLAEASMGTLSVDHLFLSANGVSVEGGVSCINLTEASIGQTMLGRAREATLVADSSKFGIACLATLCELSALSSVVTDRGAVAHEAVLQSLRDAEVATILV